MRSTEWAQGRRRPAEEGVLVSRSLFIAAAAGALVAALAACSPSQAPNGSAAPNAAATPQAPLAGMDPAVIPAGQNRGKVLQLQNGALGYTYAEVQLVTGQKVWMAGTKLDIQPGAQVEWGHANVMREFKSKSLDRTFAEILFVDRWNEVGKKPVEVAAATAHAGMPSGHPAMAASGAAPSGEPGAAPKNTLGAADQSGGGAVKSVTNSAGYSFIEVDQGGGKSVWVAAMQTPMKAGDQVKWQGGMTMNNFTSRSLNRTFEQIVFASALTVAK
jgi:hypothetical protein